MEVLTESVTLVCLTMNLARVVSGPDLATLHVMPLIEVRQLVLAKEGRSGPESAKWLLLLPVGGFVVDKRWEYGLLNLNSWSSCCKKCEEKNAYHAAVSEYGVSILHLKLWYKKV